MLLEVVVVKACSCRTHATPPRVWASVNQLDSRGSVRFTRPLGAPEDISRLRESLSCPFLYLDSNGLVTTVHSKDLDTPIQRYFFFESS